MCIRDSFAYFNKEIGNSSAHGVRLRGLKVTMYDDASNIYFCEAEFLCANESSLIHLCSIFRTLTKQAVFIKLKIVGDFHLDNIKTNKKITEKGFQALTEQFQTGVFPTLTEFSFTDFEFDEFPFLKFLEISFSNNMTVQTLDLARNDIPSDLAMGILQRVYYNSYLRVLDISGNDISTAEFKTEYIKPYFKYLHLPLISLSL